MHHPQWSWSQGYKICHCFQFFPFYLPWSDGIGFHFLCSLPVSPNEHYLIKVVVRRLLKGFPFFFFFLSLLEELSIDWNRIILSFIFLAQAVKNLPAMQETWVWSLVWEDPLEKGIAPHSNILAWRIPWTEEPNGLQSMGLQRVRHDWAMNTQVIFFISFFILLIYHWMTFLISNWKFCQISYWFRVQQLNEIKYDCWRGFPMLC